LAAGPGQDIEITTIPLNGAEAVSKALNIERITPPV
jgi:hypothetical protein